MDIRGAYQFVLLASITGLLTLVASCRSTQVVDAISPVSRTRTDLVVMHAEIEAFWNRHGQVPSTAEELPKTKNRDNTMKDGWGGDFHWVSDGANKVQVWSLGRDGVQGGVGEDADIGFVFVGKHIPQDDFPEIESMSGK